MNPQYSLMDRLHAYALHQGAIVLLHVMLSYIACKESGTTFRLSLPTTVVCYVSMTRRH